MTIITKMPTSALEALVLDLRTQVADLKARLDKMGDEIVTKRIRVVGDEPGPHAEPGDGTPYVEISADRGAAIRLGSTSVRPSVRIDACATDASIWVRTSDADEAPTVQILAYAEIIEEPYAQVALLEKDDESVLGKETVLGATQVRRAPEAS